VEDSESGIHGIDEIDGFAESEAGNHGSRGLHGEGKVSSFGLEGLAAFFGEAVFLQAAGRFVREGALDEADVFRRPKIVFPKRRA
jgi:hypothetical protein